MAKPDHVGGHGKVKAARVKTIYRLTTDDAGVETIETMTLSQHSFGREFQHYRRQGWTTDPDGVAGDAEDEDKEPATPATPTSTTTPAP